MAAAAGLPLGPRRAAVSKDAKKESRPAPISAACLFSVPGGDVPLHRYGLQLSENPDGSTGTNASKLALHMMCLVAKTKRSDALNVLKCVEMSSNSLTSARARCANYNEDRCVCA